MEFPISTIPLGDSEAYSIHDDDTYNTFLDSIQEFINADCRAIVINGEVVVNSYEKKSYREQIIDRMIRYNLGASLHSLLYGFHQENKNAQIVLYMYEKIPWKIVIDFIVVDSQDSVYIVQKYQSEEFKTFNETKICVTE